MESCLSEGGLSLECAVQNTPLPPPLNLTVEPVSELNLNVPGKLKISESGELLKSYLTFSGFTDDTIQGYNVWVTEQLPQQLFSRPLRLPRTGDLVYFTNPRMYPPVIETKSGTVVLTPLIARSRNLTYSSSLYVDLALYRNGAPVIRTINGVEQQVVMKNVYVGKIPVMLGSVLCHLHQKTDEEKFAMGECPKDPLAYFIIKGIEKIVFIQEKLRLNRYFIFNKVQETVCKMVCATPRGTTMVGLSMGDNRSIRLGLHFLGKGDTTMGVFQAFRIFFRAYNMLPPEASPATYAVWFVLSFVEEKHKKKIQSVLQTSLVDMLSIADDFEYLRSVIPGAKASDAELAQTLSDELFPQMSEPLNKLYMLSLMIAQYALYIAGLRGLDDRDNVGNKRFESAGPSLQQLFGGLWNKAVNTAEASIASLVSDKKEIEREYSSGHELELFKRYFRANIITDELVDSFTPGNWGVRGSYTKDNITDTLNRESVLSSYAQITKINTPTRRQAKQPHIRMVQMSQLGFVDPVETPEGRAVGLIKHKAIGAYASLPGDDTVIVEQIRPYLAAIRSETATNGCIVNGRFVGWCAGTELKDFLISLKRSQRISHFTSISIYRDNVLYVFTDGSRLTRPLLVVEEGVTVYEKKKLQGSDFQTLLQEGAVEYVDATEQDQLYIAQTLEMLREQRAEIANLLMKRNEAQTIVDRLQVPEEQDVREIRYRLPEQITSEVDGFEVITNVANLSDEEAYELYRKTLDLALSDLSQANEALERLSKKASYTHCELNPNALFGISANLLPLPEHNMGPRNMYTCGMMKQALGAHHSNHPLRFESVKMMLAPSAPIFATQLNEWLGLDELPSGETVTVAIMPYYGYNQEDAFVFNKASVERGLFGYVIYDSYTAVESKKDKDIVETFRKPTLKAGEDPKVYRALGDNGVARIGYSVEPGDVLISKTKENRVTGRIEIDNVRVGIGERGVVDRILIDKNEEGLTLVKVKIRDVRLSTDPIIGDKFACLTPSAQVLTRRGFIPIDTLTLEDEVATLKEGKLVYEKPSALHCYDYEGPMYSMKSQLVEQTVTPNHRMWVKKRDAKNFDFLRADDCVGKRLRHKKDAEWDAPDLALQLPEDRIDEVVYPCKVLDMDAWLTFFGIWIAEGWADHKTLRTTFAANKPRVQKALTDVCARLGYRVFTPKSHKWNIGDKQLGNYLSTLSVGSTNKRLPEWCFNLSSRQSRLLLEGLMLGDGYKMKSGGAYQYYTSSQGLSDDVSILALHAGWSANIIKRSEAGSSVWFEARQEYITSTADAYVVKIIRTKNEPQMNHGHTKTQNGQSEQFVPYSGKVYCCTVSSGVFYIRENGKTVWTGNSRHAQKGTIGLIVPEEDMPFNPITGMRPDILINPLAIPSRMTIAKLMEIVASKVGALRGERVNATGFDNFDIRTFEENLVQYGYERRGTEQLYSGVTGKPIEARIFVGLCYYQQLRHLVNKKIQVRSSGLYKAVSHQPVGGRSKGGGIRAGEMEKNALISHGATNAALDTLLYRSDAYKTVFCTTCGRVAISNPKYDKPVCRNCEEKAEFGTCTIPYAYKWLTNLLAASGVDARFNFKKKEDVEYSK